MRERKSLFLGFWGLVLLVSLCLILSLSLGRRGLTWRSSHAYYRDVRPLHTLHKHVHPWFLYYFEVWTLSYSELPLKTYSELLILSKTFSKQDYLAKTYSELTFFNWVVSFLLLPIFLVLNYTLKKPKQIIPYVIYCFV